MITSREIRLKSRIVGAPVANNFELATVSVPAPALGEVQVKNSWMSVDPYMRGRMVDRTSYDPHPPLGVATPAREIGEVAASNSTMYGWRPPFQLGEALQGGAVGEVVASEDPGFKPGDLVSSMFGWRERFNAPVSTVEKLDHSGAPASAFLGVAGVTGLTAWGGLLKIAGSSLAMWCLSRPRLVPLDRSPARLPSLKATRSLDQRAVRTSALFSGTLASTTSLITKPPAI